MLSEKLKEFRKENKLTQKELAKKLGVSRSNIAEMEAGRVKGKLTIIKQLAELSEKPLSWWADTENNDIKIDTYDAINTFIDTLIDTNIIKDDGKIPNNLKDTIITILEKEIQLKIYRLKNK